MIGMVGLVGLVEAEVEVLVMMALVTPLAQELAEEDISLAVEAQEAHPEIGMLRVEMVVFMGEEEETQRLKLRQMITIDFYQQARVDCMEEMVVQHLMARLCQEQMEPY